MTERAVVLDASTILAFVQGEDGAYVVEAALADDPRCGPGNWSLVRALLTGYAIQVDPVSIDDGEWAARRWRRGEGLSLGDRLCLALGERVDADVLTADSAWGSDGRVKQIR